MNPQYSQLPPPPAGNYNGSQPNVITSATDSYSYIPKENNNFFLSEFGKSNFWNVVE